MRMNYGKKKSGERERGIQRKRERKIYFALRKGVNWLELGELRMSL